MDTMQTMRERVAKGLDPLTGQPFQTCAPHSVSARGATTVCDGCGKPVELSERSDWRHVSR